MECGAVIVMMVTINKPFQRGERHYTSKSDVRLYTSEADVCRRQILTTKTVPAQKELRYF